MKMNKVSGLFAAGAALLAIGGASAPAWAEYGETVYYFCHVSQDTDDGYVYYYSATMGVDKDVYSVGIQNSFNSFVTAHYDPHVISGAICLGPYESWQDAEDKRNDDIGDTRRRDWDVVLTRWTYHGD